MDYFKIIESNTALKNDIELLCDFRLNFTDLDTSLYGYPVDNYKIFGADASGGKFGFIGDGDISSLPIGYISSEGSAGKVANNLSDFFHLITFYPYWHDLCSIKSLNDKSWIAKLEEGRKEFDENYEQRQNSIANLLQLDKNNYFLSNFHTALTSEPKFVTYLSSEGNNPSEDLFRI